MGSTTTEDIFYKYINIYLQRSAEIIYVLKL